jgi:hypothetical protein
MRTETSMPVSRVAVRSHVTPAPITPVGSQLAGSDLIADAGRSRFTTLSPNRSRRAPSGLGPASAVWMRLDVGHVARTHITLRASRAPTEPLPARRRDGPRVSRATGGVAPPTSGLDRQRRYPPPRCLVATATVLQLASTASAHTATLCPCIGRHRRCPEWPFRWSSMPRAPDPTDMRRSPQTAKVVGVRLTIGSHDARSRKPISARGGGRVACHLRAPATNAAHLQPAARRRLR